MIVKLLLECADNMLWFYIQTNGSIYIRHNLLIIQLESRVLKWHQLSNLSISLRQSANLANTKLHGAE